MEGNSVEYSLGIDLGTSGVKAGLLNLDTLKLEFVSMQAYDDSLEQDPEAVWERTVRVVKDSISSLGGQARIVAIGLSGQMHGAVLCDRRGELISPIITWKDRKWSTKVMVEKIKLSMAGRTWAELGTEISSGVTAAILYGIRENRPDLFRRIAHFVLPVDFLRGKLLGENSYATDPTNAGGTGLFNTQAGCWHTELIARLGLPVEIFPQLHQSDQVAGRLSAGFGHAVGLEAGLPVIYGGGDNQMSMLGSGLAGPAAPLLVNIGTAAQVSKVIAEFQRYPGLDTRPFFDGHFAAVLASLAGGGSYARLQAERTAAQGIKLDYPQMDNLAAQVSPGADGLIFCPGPTRQALDRRMGFRGNVAWQGDPAHRARAVLEGVIMDLYDGVENLERDAPGELLLGSGKGLQRSPLWAQIAADLLGKPLRITRVESAVWGAALLAARGCGAIEDLDQAVRTIEYVAEKSPEPDRAKFYREQFVPFWHQAVLAA
jgi:xylulokinase